MVLHKVLNANGGRLSAIWSTLGLSSLYGDTNICCSQECLCQAQLLAQLHLDKKCLKTAWLLFISTFHVLIIHLSCCTPVSMRHTQPLACQLYSCCNAAMYRYVRDLKRDLLSPGSTQSVHLEMVVNVTSSFFELNCIIRLCLKLYQDKVVLLSINLYWSSKLRSRNVVFANFGLYCQIYSILQVPNQNNYRTIGWSLSLERTGN